MPVANLLAAIESSASNNGCVIRLEGDARSDARGLLAGGLADLFEGENGCAVLTGCDPEGRWYHVELIDVYAHELSTR